MAKPAYIFIVGLGRTGSTLTQQILNSSEEIGLGSESHFFRDLPRFLIQRRPSFRDLLAKAGDIATDEGAEKVVDFIFNTNDRHYSFWNLRAKNVDRDYGNYTDDRAKNSVEERSKELFFFFEDGAAGASEECSSKCER